MATTDLEPDPGTVPDTLAGADLDQIQALQFQGGARRFPWSSFLFVQVPDDPEAARRWLRELRADVEWYSKDGSGARKLAGGTLRGRLQLALTTRGLRRLGLPGEIVQRFPFEAKAGMERRARVLGDPVTDPSEGEPLDTLEQFERNKPRPTDWNGDGGIDLSMADAMLLLLATSRDDRQALDDHERARVKRFGGTIVTSEYSGEWLEREPFGFADRVSQPVIRGAPAPSTPTPAPGNEIAAGELLLGYRNEYHQVPKSPRFDVNHPTRGGFDVGKNGTFLVFRKLEQDVVGFWKTFATLGKQFAGQPVGDGYTVPSDPFAAAHWLAARAMGRWTNGNSTMSCPHAAGPRLGSDTINDFVYGDDPLGLTCPIGSHVRRANPRDQRGGPVDESWKVVKRHRILRRGRAYGTLYDPDALLRSLLAGEEIAPAEPSGLLFACLQASITHGFEFVQQIWNNNPGFHGVFQEPDVVAGPGGSTFTIPARPMRLRTPPMPRFITSRGGGYFFMPSRDTVDLLADGV